MMYALNGKLNGGGGSPSPNYLKFSFGTFMIKSIVKFDLKNKI